MRKYTSERGIRSTRTYSRPRRWSSITPGGRFRRRWGIIAIGTPPGTDDPTSPGRGSAGRSPATPHAAPPGTAARDAARRRPTRPRRCCLGRRHARSRSPRRVAPAARRVERPRPSTVRARRSGLAVRPPAVTACSGAGDHAVRAGDPCTARGPQEAGLRSGVGGLSPAGSVERGPRPGTRQCARPCTPSARRARIVLAALWLPKTPSALVSADRA